MWNLYFRLLIIGTLVFQFNVAAFSNTNRERVEVLSLDNNNKISISSKTEFKGRYRTKRSRIFITTKVFSGDTLVFENIPYMIDGSIYSKKRERINKLNNEEGLGGIGVPLNNGMLFCENIDITLPYQINEGKVINIISMTGCGECSVLDTVIVGYISNPITLMDSDKDLLKLSWVKPVLNDIPKIREYTGVANLYFEINKSEIDLEHASNKSEMNLMYNVLDSIVNDTLASLIKVNITGLASADGPSSFNSILSERRATSAYDWLSEKMKCCILNDKYFVSSRSEGWWPVYEKMKSDGNIYARDILDIISAYDNEDYQERLVRRLSCWNEIKSSYLENYRKVEYKYLYEYKIIGQEDLKTLFQTRKDAFSESELFRLSLLTSEKNELLEVYRTLVHYYPQSDIARNNLAVLLINNNLEEEAEKLLKDGSAYSAESLNNLAATYVYRYQYQKAIELIQDLDFPTARYNLGIIKALQRRFSEAYVLLKPYKDRNAAIVALSLNKNFEAYEILTSIDDKSDIANYARLIVAARLGDDSFFWRNISILNNNLLFKERAKTEVDFIRYKNDSRFIEVIN